jgi:hypothetical protein
MKKNRLKDALKNGKTVFGSFLKLIDSSTDSRLWIDHVGIEKIFKFIYFLK